MKAILITIYVSIALCANAYDDISLRLNPSLYDETTKTLYVNVELRYLGHGHLQLADQNYRLFYDSELLSLLKDQSRSDLPQDLYSKLQFMEVLEDLEADAVNQLSFDDQLGFINFNIDLNNASTGGLAIKEEDEWQRVAVLNFKVSDESALSEIVWSKSGATDGYATAFVEIMEWVAPNKTEPVEVNEYIDAAFNNENEESYSFTLAPNPSTDFIKLSFDEILKDDLKVSIYDVTGRTVKNTQAFRGATNLNLVIADLIAGNYTVELTHSESGESVYKSNFIKIDQ